MCDVISNAIAYCAVISRLVRFVFTSELRPLVLGVCVCVFELVVGVVSIYSPLVV